MQKHPMIPKHLHGEEVLKWLEQSAVETFTQKIPHYYSPEEIQDFEHESAVSGREHNRLKAIVKQVTDLVTKGNPDEPQTIVIPVTLGTKVLDSMRGQNYANIDRGYDEVETRVFAIPYAEGKTMEFFTEDGKHISDRSRGMSVKEQHEHIGVFLMNTPVVKTDQETGESYDANTGEVIDKTGTHE